MKFKDLKVGQDFRHLNSELVWRKAEPFTAYGHIKNQNATVCTNGQWHYDHVDDEQEVITFVKLFNMALYAEIDSTVDMGLLKAELTEELLERVLNRGLATRPRLKIRRND